MTTAAAGRLLYRRQRIFVRLYEGIAYSRRTNVPAAGGVAYTPVTRRLMPGVRARTRPLLGRTPAAPPHRRPRQRHASCGNNCGKAHTRAERVQVHALKRFSP